jgi:hypothetical protein
MFPSSGAECMNKFVERFSCPEPSSLIMEAVTSYETLVYIYQTARRHSNSDVSRLEKTFDVILVRFGVLTAVVMKSSVF